MMLRPRTRVSGTRVGGTRVGGIVPGRGLAATMEFESLLMDDKEDMENGDIAYHLGLNENVNTAANRLLPWLTSGLPLTNMILLNTRDPENKSGGESSSSSSSSSSVPFCSFCFHGLEKSQAQER